MATVPEDEANNEEGETLRNREPSVGDDGGSIRLTLGFFEVLYA